MPRGCTTRRSRSRAASTTRRSLVEQALELLATGVVDGGALIDGQIGLAQVEDGLQRMARSEVIKLAVIP